jgi:hypothetical protein
MSCGAPCCELHKSRPVETIMINLKSILLAETALIYGFLGKTTLSKNKLFG